MCWVTFMATGEQENTQHFAVHACSRSLCCNHANLTVATASADVTHNNPNIISVYTVWPLNAEALNMMVPLETCSTHDCHAEMEAGRALVLFKHVANDPYSVFHILHLLLQIPTFHLSYHQHFHHILSCDQTAEIQQTFQNN